MPETIITVSAVLTGIILLVASPSTIYHLRKLIMIWRGNQRNHDAQPVQNTQPIPLQLVQPNIASQCNPVEELLTHFKRIEKVAATLRSRIAWISDDKDRRTCEAKLDEFVQCLTDWDLDLFDKPGTHEAKSARLDTLEAKLKVQWEIAKGHPIKPSEKWEGMKTNNGASPSSAQGQ